LIAVPIGKVAAPFIGTGFVADAHRPIMTPGSTTRCPYIGSGDVWAYSVQCSPNSAHRRG
jgi:hypothetical protein